MLACLPIGWHCSLTRFTTCTAQLFDWGRVSYYLALTSNHVLQLGSLSSSELCKKPGMICRMLASTANSGKSESMELFICTAVCYPQCVSLFSRREMTSVLVGSIWTYGPNIPVHSDILGHAMFLMPFECSLIHSQSEPGPSPQISFTFHHKCLQGYQVFFWYHTCLHLRSVSDVLTGVCKVQV